MAPRRHFPQNSPALKAFGAQLRRAREAKKIKQTTLAELTNTHGSFVSKVENGFRRCNADFVRQADAYLETNGALIELWEDLNREGHPVPLWFDWPEIEKDAVELTAWQPNVIPGLLQHEDYARTFFTDDESAAARIERQKIITRAENPTKLVALIKKEVLYYLVNSKEAMSKQLEYLLEMSERPNVTIQIVMNDGLPAGVDGACVVAFLEDRSQVAYIDTMIRGITTDAPEDLAAIADKLIKIRGKALPVSMSRDAIREAIQAWT
ncbi:helix-turn-helix transcriptional regulator [Actinomadura kijaniata]|uniref:Transcriptional regulator with XRE-family HTH domain n=1 Tax=Actinomadura namibiensis TaxID=182080 RepID=A0A7W3QR22_ACTNM|nr:helix-turn-helix transcriptional regulator [Actinomadura namibiensis]MBA8956335.1 transcriptional regulator with XRE-family HTH domain [Actinomadura namibiensis]